MDSLSVLVVDDEEADRYILIRQLRSAGLTFEAFQAANGQEAIDFFENYDANRLEHGDRFPPLVIFLDINMPLVDGFQFLESFESLRAKQQVYGSCVIMMFSSSESPSDRARAFSKDFVKDYIVKGKTPSQEIRAKVESLMGDAS